MPDEFRRLFNYDYYLDRLNNIIENTPIYDLNILQRYLAKMIDICLIEEFDD
jgi:hypothetical protein